MAEQAILLVHFGTSRIDALKKALWAIERETRAAYPDWEVRGGICKQNSSSNPSTAWYSASIGTGSTGCA